ncbi:M-phase inducer phosphatase 1 [Mactra antiquata]
MERFVQKRPLALKTLATSNTMPNVAACSSFDRCEQVYSPVTNLTLDLSELSTGRGTPRRKLSLSCTDTPTTGHPVTERSISSESSESGCCLDSPMIESPMLEHLSSQSRFPVLQPLAEVASRKKSVAYRRFNSMPVSTMLFNQEDIENNAAVANQSTPQSTNVEQSALNNQKLMNISVDSTNYSVLHSSSDSDRSSSSQSSEEKKVTFYIDDCSQDSGLGVDRTESRDSKDSEDGFMFAAPKGFPVRRQSKLISEDTCSPFKYSPVKDVSPSKCRNSCLKGALDFSGEFEKSPPQTGDGSLSPLKICRLTSEDEGIGDDGFLDIMDAEVAALTQQQSTCNTSSAMSSLFNAPVINKKSHISQDDEDTPVTRRALSRRNISRSISMMGRLNGKSCKRDRSDISDSPMQFSFKRDPPQDESTPIQRQKRARPASVIGSPEPVVSRPSLHRCYSESEAMIKSALNRQADEPDLVGDCSRTHCLPTYGGKHQDMKYISGRTLSQVIEGEYSHDVEQAIIIDCRYPYEYEGGHIQGAKNLYIRDQIIEEFLKNPITPSDPSKRVILIFHCEFSSERGPKMSRFLRKSDRQANKDCYPNLYYPELYLLDGGYKEYFATEKEFCVPQTYKPMLHKDHADDLRHFRTKSKSWAGEQRGGRPSFRPLKY